MSVRPFAFVLMPFTADFDDIYKFGIQATCLEADVLAERVDEQTYSETILERIYRQIQVADFVIADMTGRNPNVFYEVGFAHANSKLCTLLTQSADDIPFDLKHHRHIVYEGSIEKLKSALRREIEWLKLESAQRKQQSLTLSVQSTLGNLEKSDWLAYGDFDLTIDIHNYSAKRSPEIEAIYVHTNNDWNFTQDGVVLPKNQIDKPSKKVVTQVKPPVARLSPGGWSQFKISGRRVLWTKHSGDAAKEIYKQSGSLPIELHTSEGVLSFQVDVSVEFEEVPF